MHARDQPFNDLPPLPPTADVEIPAVLKKAITASRALAELKGMAESSLTHRNRHRCARASRSPMS